MNYFQENIAHGRENKWKCRAGARYLYICEDGLVHYCSQQRGYPGKPLAEYTKEDIRREFITEKGCAPRCTVAACTTLPTWISGARHRPFPLLRTPRTMAIAAAAISWFSFRPGD